MDQNKRKIPFDENSKIAKKKKLFDISKYNKNKNILKFYKTFLVDLNVSFIEDLKLDFCYIFRL